MIDQLSITVLVDNAPGRLGLKTEHGLSLWIETESRRILFDAGQSDMLLHNAEQLNIDLSTADSVILSHGHYDHTGGIAHVLSKLCSATIYCHSSVFVPRYSRQSDGRMKPIGIDKNSSKALHDAYNRIHWVNEAINISEDFGITGPIPRNTDFENTGGDFYFDPDGNRPDPVNDDLALWFRTTKGIIVVTGCCHSGIINTLEYVKTLSLIHI